MNLVNLLMVPTNSSLDDPFALALAPPPDETPDQRVLRLAAESQARRVSEEIDEELRAERLARKKRKVVKVLLLGQSESGKPFNLIAGQGQWLNECGLYT